MTGQPVGVVIDDDPTTPPDVATDGEPLDWFVADKRLADATTGAEWCADRLREIAKLPQDSHVRQLIEQAVQEVKDKFSITDEEIDSET
jgi:hypothetical protein